MRKILNCNLFRVIPFFYFWRWLQDLDMSVILNNRDEIWYIFLFKRLTTHMENTNDDETENDLLKMFKSFQPEITI